MMLASDKLRVVPLTIHMPLAEVPARRSRTQAIVETGEIILTALRARFRHRAARAWRWPASIPHAGEDGVLGGEDDAMIAPAVAALKARGHRRARAAVRRHAVPRRSAQDL